MKLSVDPRVLIAKDVLARLDYMSPTRNTCYVQLSLTQDDDRVQGDELLFDAIKRQDSSDCTVCALGAMFVSRLCRSRMTIKDILQNGGSLADDALFPEFGDVYKALHAVFPIAQLEMIESAFEGKHATHHGHGDPDGHASWADRQTAIRAFAEYYDTTDAVRAIMENIIANNGEFVP